MSSAGKSVITAGLCRIFHQDGLRTAPFKSQNMALNSYITADGFEMGRAQVMQAEAAGIMPDVRMNPILLKPTSEAGSQVIVNGEVYGNMTAKEYYRHKQTLIPEIQKAYDALAAEYDMIVLEGAGSPAEINLRDVDVVNMGMAALADAPVILVGDIDRGGVVPYLPLHLEEEDSLAEQLTQQTVSAADALDIAVIRFPRISNFTDFAVFDCMEGVSVRYVTSAKQLGEPDLIILPGTKNTLQDLRWMRQNGLEAAILKRHEKGCFLFGICGGLQMLGKQISDPYGVEDGGQLRGMGLLDVETTFCQEKHRSQVQGTVCSLSGTLQSLSGCTINGYEMHMGDTTNNTALPFTKRQDGTCNGYCSADGTVYGTYLHGIFDTSAFVESLVQGLQEKKGVSHVPIQFDLQQEKEKQYDFLADALRQHLDISRIYEIIDTWAAKR
jgi:adenosylcobyric acid synthase